MAFQIKCQRIEALINARVNWIKAILALKVKNPIISIVELFDLAKFLDLIIFVFLDWSKLGSKSRLTIWLTLVPVAIVSHMSDNLVIFNIEESDAAILLKL